MAAKGSDRNTLLADVAGIVSRSHDLAETLGNVVDRVAKRLDADVCSIYLTDPGRKTLVLRATKGLARESVGRVRLAAGEGLVGLVAGRSACRWWGRRTPSPPEASSTSTSPRPARSASPR
jgi:signal transduction protein with GAF and PtsI domain